MNLQVQLIADFLPSQQAAELFEYVQQEVRWKQEWIELYGRRLRIPRLQAFYADTPSTYTYSNATFKSSQMTGELTEIKELVAYAAHTEFNSILLNRYRDGLDYVSWHADNEPELGPDPIIASLSLGAERRFCFKNSTSKVEMLLPHNSLLIMGPDVQSNWQHCLPKSTKIKAPRISLTFRQIQGN